MAIVKTKKKNGSRPPKSSRARKRRLARKQAHLNFEALEPRQLLAAVTVCNATDLTNAPDLTSIAALVANDGGDGISLREAITATNNTTGANTITFDTSVFNGEAADVIRLNNTLPLITQSLSIDGGSQNIVISADTDGNDTTVPGTFITDIAASETAGTLADNTGRVLDITAGAGETVNLIGLTITGGDQTGLGGGIINGAGALNVTNSSVSGNRSSLSGGGIFTGTGAVNVTNSTVSGNTVAFQGGGIYAAAGSNVNLTNSTISGNQAFSGGGLYVYNGATVTIDNSTIVLNNSTSFITTPGGLASLGTTTVNNSIIVGNTSQSGIEPDISAGPLTSLSGRFNLLGFGDVQNLGSNNQTGVTFAAAGLGPLADNGGPTQTHALLLDSPAIDAGNSAFTIATDQRGLARPVDQANVANAAGGNGSDIGAVEFQEQLGLSLIHI